jgi:hypothetical protein
MKDDTSGDGLGSGAVYDSGCGYGRGYAGGKGECSIYAPMRFFGHGGGCGNSTDRGSGNGRGNGFESLAARYFEKRRRECVAR